MDSQTQAGFAIIADALRAGHPRHAKALLEVARMEPAEAQAVLHELEKRRREGGEGDG